MNGHFEVVVLAAYEKETLCHVERLAMRRALKKGGFPFFQCPLSNVRSRCPILKALLRVVFP